jgi:hypothetical protein
MQWLATPGGSVPSLISTPDIELLFCLHSLSNKAGQLAQVHNQDKRSRQQQRSQSTLPVMGLVIRFPPSSDFCDSQTCS